MKRFLFSMMLLICLHAFANDSTRLYDPKANAEKDVAVALAKAKKEGKHVLLQIGGNWCVWCYRFNSFVLLDSTLKNALNNNYVVYHLNYSPENKNLDYLKKLGFPQRFGFPVLVVLDADGNRLHTQDSALLEKGNGYDKDKVKRFLTDWSPVALKESNYKE
jgi:thiol:disulfide interchange protein